MTELEALKIALGVLVAIGAGLLVGGIYLGKMTSRLTDHSEEIHLIGLQMIRLVAAVNRIAEGLGTEKVEWEDEWKS